MQNSGATSYGYLVSWHPQFRFALRFLRPLFNWSNLRVFRCREGCSLRPNAWGHWEQAKEVTTDGDVLDGEVFSGTNSGEIPGSSAEVTILQMHYLFIGMFETGTADIAGIET
jgi:hypothetical protein